MKVSYKTNQLIRNRRKIYSEYLINIDNLLYSKKDGANKNKCQLGKDYKKGYNHDYKH